MPELDLDPARIAAAAEVIDPVFLNSPQYVDDQLCRRLGRTVVVKDETRNPVRSFKGRGAEFLVDGLPPGRHVVCASAGNFGQGIAFACRGADLRCTVFMAPGGNPIAIERIEILGADVRLAPGDGAEPKGAARQFAEGSPERLFVEDGEEAAIAEGAGTIGLELLAAGALDAVIVPVGDGALIAGIGCAIKHHAPSVRVVGVCPAAAPSVAESWRSGVPTRADANTIADGLSTVDPVPRSVARMRALVDEILLVSESALIEGVELAASALGALLEPSGAASLAALLEHEPAGERVAVILTGSVARPEPTAPAQPGGR